MDNIININNTKENALEFEMTIEGLNTSDVECNFVIEAKGMELRFDAVLEDAKANKWLVKLPRLDILERTTYNCYTEVIAEGQYFTPMKGNVNVVGTAEIYTSSPKNLTIESDQKKNAENRRLEEQRETARKNQVWRQKEKSIEQIAKELMEQKDFGTEKVDKLVEEKRQKKASGANSNDDKVRAILKEAGIEPKKKKKEKVSFVKTRLLNS